MNTQLNVDDIKFMVGEDREIYLCVGPCSIEVCETASDFPDFIENLVVKLRRIEDEFRENGWIEKQ